MSGGEFSSAGFQGRSDRDVAAIKIPPHSMEAEQSVLGGLMLDNSAWDDVAERVAGVDFYRHDHRLIFAVIGKLAEEAKPVDVVTVQEALANRGELQDCGGLPYLAELAKNTPSVANIRAYSEIVRERSVLRQMIAVSNDIASSAFNPDGRDTAELLDSAERKVFEIAEQGQRNQGGPEAIKPLLAKAVDRIDELFSSDNAITGITSGFTDLDNMLSGFQPSDLIIVAGRPSMGKTTFALNVAENAAIKTGKPVLIFSMEMPGESLVMRMLSSLGRINQTRIRSGKLEEDDWPRLNSAISLLADQKIYIDDTGGLSPTEMRARARRIFRDHGEMGLIMVDYLQLMQVPGSNSRVEEISEISRCLKGLAKELNTPVMALSQLNRGLEQRPNKRPIMSDLRESGAIEQDADVIMFIYRDEVYNEDTPDKGIGEIIIGKQRNGPIGTIRLAFHGIYTKFEDLAHDYGGSME
ncbi:MAG: replicative DNA helicase [Pseudomonadales bacterium]|nr:replicative DNA helicase [Pseudomonadales bacterium]